MSGHNTADSSRKPSGSSTHSGAHSPTSSPSNAQPQRKLTSATAGNVFGVGIGGPNGLKSLNSGWQVWGSATPSSKRNASISSAASGTDLPASQTDTNYRGNLGEGWTASGPVTSTWDDSQGSPKKKDFSQLESHPPLNLHHTRQRQANAVQVGAFSGSRMDDRGSKAGQFSPQRYDIGLGKDSTARYTSSAPPTKPFGAGAYNPAGTYESLQPSSIANNDLSLALRGMAVEDDFNMPQNRQHRTSSQRTFGHAPNPQTRAPPPIPPSRAQYNAYPQADYGGYYPNPPGRDSYLEYLYGYDAYRSTSDPSLYASAMSSTSPQSLYPGVAPQNLHLSAAADLHRQQAGLFYDYGASSRPLGSQFYYPSPQAIMYPPPAHSPMMASHSSTSSHATLGDKKRDLQYNTQQQIGPQNLMYSAMRSTPSPHTRAFPSAIDYGSQIPVMLPGSAIFSHNPQAMHVYSQGMRAGRRSDGTEASLALRSPLLDEFRANKAHKWELRDIFGYVVEFSGDQHGSRFIQQKLETATSEEKQIVFDEIVPDNTLQLIQDVFGNYVIQKLFEHGTQVQKTVLANIMEGHVLALSLQMYGCRVVQKAIECVLPDQQGAFVRELETHALRCVKDANGNHVIQKLIERVSPDRLGFINNFRGNVLDLATHPYGCRVLQRCLEHLPEELARPLLDELHMFTINLMQDQFGNYVIQFVLEHGKPQDKALVLLKLRGQVLQMARHKFASNVCEKALLTADPESRRLLIDEIMTPKQDGVSPIVAMMKDQFANYVLQRALAVADGEQKEALVSKIRPQLASMRRYSSAYSKHLISIERLLDKYTNLPQLEHSRERSIMPPELIIP